MREIEFRGKRKGAGEWVYGDLDQKAIVEGYKTIQTAIRWRDKLNSYGYAVVIPETVGQYTCLKDKNGSKIFDGDIVKTIYSPNCLNEPIMGIVSVNKFNQWCLLANGKEYHIENAINGEVIGNIHDNCEPLEDNKCPIN